MPSDAKARGLLTLHATPYHSLLQGALADGCRSCVTGEKLVLFVTGVCPAKCFFCPLSPEKKQHDVAFANEQELTGSDEERLAQLIAEARANKATGAGITGGDPLARLSRTCFFIKGMKTAFGKQFHTHLYTPLLLVNESTLARLHDAGLDEIRFHPDLEDERFWERITLARTYDWKVGIEIPVLPDKVAESTRLITYAHSFIDFLNLNELEISELTIDEFARRGYRIKSRESYAISGSKEAARTLLAVARQYDLPAHFCTTRLKDRIQMGNRIKRRAANTAHPFDEIDEEGLLTRGAVYLHYTPGFGYNKVLKALTQEERNAELSALQNILSWLRMHGMPMDAGVVDEERLRVLLNAEALRSLAPQLKKTFPVTCARITEWPTSDAFIVELEKL